MKLNPNRIYRDVTTPSWGDSRVPRFPESNRRRPRNPSQSAGGPRTLRCLVVAAPEYCWQYGTFRRLSDTTESRQDFARQRSRPGTLVHAQFRRAEHRLGPSGLLDPQMSYFEWNAIFPGIV